MRFYDIHQLLGTCVRSTIVKAIATYYSQLAPKNTTQIQAWLIGLTTRSIIWVESVFARQASAAAAWGLERAFQSAAATTIAVEYGI